MLSRCVSSTRVKQRADTDRWSPEGERRSPSEDEGDEKTPSAAAEIHNAEDHQEIFHPKKVLRRCRSAAAPFLTLKCPAAVNQLTNHGAASPPPTPFPHQLARRPGCRSRFPLRLKTVSVEEGSANVALTPPYFPPPLPPPPREQLSHWPPAKGDHDSLF